MDQAKTYIQPRKIDMAFAKETRALLAIASTKPSLLRNSTTKRNQKFDDGPW
jgi:hypothetical protein